MNKIIEKNEEDIIKWRHYNANHLTRTFPKFFLRFDSSNYNPLIAWAMGCQLVALNIQVITIIYNLFIMRLMNAGYF